MDERLPQLITQHLRDGKLPCSQAHAIARQLDLPPLDVGLAANELDIRISHCLLGLFGYGPKAEGKHKIVQPMDEVPEDLAAALRAAADGQAITCTAIWQVADSLGYKRLKASAAVEALGLKVSRCQLGCFPRPWEG